MEVVKVENMVEVDLVEAAKVMVEEDGGGAEEMAKEEEEARVVRRREGYGIASPFVPYTRGGGR